MNLKPLLLIFALLGSSLMTTTVFSAEQVYGWQLMSEQERNQYRDTMRNFKTEQERERYRIEHHNMMMERAREQGVTLPEEPGKNQMNNSGSGGRGMGGGMGGGGR